MEVPYTIKLENERTPLFRKGIYFKDKNEGKYIEEFIETDSCAGDGGCIRLLKEAPFEWRDNELLNSTKFDESINFDRYYKSYIKEVTICQSGLWLRLNVPLYQGDIIVPQADCNLEYYISYVHNWVNKNGFVVKIDKMDESRVDDLDVLLSAFKEGRAINVIGYLK